MAPARAAPPLHHGAIGHALERALCGRTEEVAELLALHFGRSDDAEQAVDYAILAAEKAQRRWANNDALSYFDDALRRLDADAGNGSQPAAPHRRGPQAGRGQFCAWTTCRAHPSPREQFGALSKQLAIRAAGPPGITGPGFLHGLTGGRPERRDRALPRGGPDCRLFRSRRNQRIRRFLFGSGLYRGRQAPRRDRCRRTRTAAFEARGDLWWAGRTLWHLSSAANYLGEWEASRSYSRRALEHGGPSMICVSRPSAGGVSGLRTFCKAIWRGARNAAMKRWLSLPTHAMQRWPAQRVGMGKSRPAAPRRVSPNWSEAVAWFQHLPARFTHLNYALWLAEGHLRRADRIAARALLEYVLETSRETGYRLFEGRAHWLMGDCLAAEAPIDGRRSRRQCNGDFGTHRRAKRFGQGYGSARRIAATCRRRPGPRGSFSIKPTPSSGHSIRTTSSRASKQRFPPLDSGSQIRYTR